MSVSQNDWKLETYSQPQSSAQVHRFTLFSVVSRLVGLQAPGRAGVGNQDGC